MARDPRDRASDTTIIIIKAPLTSNKIFILQSDDLVVGPDERMGTLPYDNASSSSLLALLNLLHRLEMILDYFS